MSHGNTTKEAHWSMVSDGLRHITHRACAQAAQPDYREVLASVALASNVSEAI